MCEFSDILEAVRHEVCGIRDHKGGIWDHRPGPDQVDQGSLTTHGIGSAVL